MEAQKSTNAKKLGYHLENRILYYLARMVSAQKQTEFFHSDFDSLKKVRSIWICMDSSEDGESIEEIGMHTETIYGNSKQQYETDLMKAIIIRIRSGRNRTASQNRLIAMLETLLSQERAEEKKQKLSQTYGMAMSAELEGRMRIMCNLSEVIEEEAIKRGLEKGLEKGIKKERLDAVIRMIHAKATREQILSYGYTQEEYAEAENSL